jgi:hypothetical protein
LPSAQPPLDVRCGGGIVSASRAGRHGRGGQEYPRPLLVAVCALGAVSVAGGQELILNMVANKVIGKYQAATCEQLWQQKGEPKSQEEQRAINFLRNDPQARTEFINKIAGPVVNKMFECGMVP